MSLRGLLVLGVIAAALGLAAGPARAGTYKLWSCAGPDGTPVGTAAWQPVTSVNGSVTLGSTSDLCASTSGLRGALTARSTPTNGPYDLSGYRLLVPLGTQITGWAVFMAGNTSAATKGGYASGLAMASGSAPPERSPIVALPSDPQCPGAAAACTFGSTASPFASANAYASSGLTWTGAFFGVRCDTTAGTAGSSCTPSAIAGGTVGTVSLYRSSFDIVDNAAPVLGPVAGTLLDPAGTTGSGSVRADATDVGGGVASVTLLVDGAVSQTQAGAGACTPPYTIAAPCPGNVQAAFDVSGLAAGTHTVVLRAVDAAGNTVDSPPSTVTVHAAPATPKPTPTPAKTIPIAVLRVAASPLKLTGRAQKIRGTLRRKGGAALAGARITVAQRAIGAASARYAHVLVARTDRKGAFVFPAGSRSRELRLTALVTNPPDPASVVLYAPLAVRLAAPTRIVHNGQAVDLRGRISGVGLGTRGRLVLVQVVTEHRWATIGSARAAASGALSWRYRFMRTRRAANYRFRFLAPVNPGEPWHTRASKRVIVRVRP